MNVLEIYLNWQGICGRVIPRIDCGTQNIQVVIGESRYDLR